MSERRFFDYDPETGAVETFHYDEETDTFAIQRAEDVGIVLDRNKELANHTTGWNADKTMRHAASIPIGVIYEWITKHGVNLFNKNHQDGVKRLLNSNEYRYLRVQHFML